MSDVFEYSRATDGTVGRRRLLGQTGIALSGERWVPGRSAWWIDPAVLDRDGFPAIGRDELPEPAAADDPVDLAAPGGRWRGRASVREVWLDDAIAATDGYIRAETEAILAELPWAMPQSWDYDFEMDKVVELRAAWAALGALVEERRAFAAGRERRRGSVRPPA